MEENNLIKKLEEISPPEIELPSHKRGLKQTLLNRYYKEKRNWAIFDIFRKLVPIGAVVIILTVLLVNNFILPTYTPTQAREIATKNPQVQNLIEEGAVIQDIKILKDKGYVLLQGQQEEIRETVGAKEEFFTEEFFGALAEVDLKKKQVSKIENVTPESYSLVEEEKAKEIAKNDPEIQRIVPKEAQITKIIPVPSLQLKLIKEKDSVRIIPEPEQERTVRIIYELNSNQWEGEIDLRKEEVKEIKLIKENKKQE
jgi:hypothetical protein